MKIAIPVLDLNAQKNRIAGGLNATGHLCIYDDTTGESLWMKTSELAANMGDLLPALEQKNIIDIITFKVQPMALKVLVNKGFRVYQSIGDKLDENLRSFSQNELAPFAMESAMLDAALCGGACDSCKTDCKDDSDENK
jgi:predicted Fe-Mo cluster-binding NifX family protein